VILVVTVEDQSTGSFSVSAGLSSSDGLIGEVAMEEKNFLGRGQNVRISVGGSDNTRDYNFSFTDPYFLGTRMSGGFDVFRTVQDVGVQPFATTNTGGDIRIGLPLNDDLNAQLNYKVSSLTTSQAAACTPGTSVTGCYFPNGTRLTSSVGYVLTYSTIDDLTNPHEGVYLRGAQDFAGAGGAARYVRSTVDARYYRPILPDSDTVGMLKVTAGNVTGLGAPVAISDNFFKGGETIRGFAPLGYGPRDNTAGSNTGGGVALGGKNFVAGTAEVSFPLPMLPPDFGLRGAVFADAGMLFGVDNPGGGVTYSDDAALRSSVGGSIIWASPFGQIRLDIAEAITKQSYDQTQMFRIGAGTQF